MILSKKVKWFFWIKPQHLIKGAGHLGFDLAHRRRFAEQVGHADDGVFGDAAGDDAVKIVHLWGDVERESVSGDVVRIDFDANRRDFGCFAALMRQTTRAALRNLGLNPDPAQARHLTSNQSQPRQGQDEGLFQFANIANVVAISQLDDGVADQLAGAVIGDIPAPVYPVDGDAAPGQFGFAPEQVICMSAPPEGVGVRMFEQEQGGGLACLRQPARPIRFVNPRRFGNLPGPGRGFRAGSLRQQDAGQVGGGIQNQVGACALELMFLSKPA
jgi:hypothetical protein